MTAFASWPARHPGQALLSLVVLIVSGAALAIRLPVERLAPLSGATLRVQAQLPGVEAAQVETSVTRPLEETLALLPSLHETVSRSRDGRATIDLRFSSAAARAAAVEETHRRLAQAVSSLPAGMAMPVVEGGDPPPHPAAIYAIAADPLSAETTQWAEQALVRPLRELSEVAGVVLDGAEASEVLIQPDSRRLATLGLSFEDLIQALQRRDEAPRQRGARRGIVAMPVSAEAIAARAVRLPTGDSIALAEVAQVSVVSRSVVETPSYRGAPALTLRVYPRLSAEAPVVAERLRAYLGWLRVNGMVPAGVEIHPTFDESYATRAWIKQILWLGGVEIASTLLAVYLFFGARAGLATLCAFGVWLPASAALWWGAGLTLNAMTLAGLMLGCVPFTAMLMRSFPPVAAAILATIAAVLPWGVDESLRPYAPSAFAFSLATLLGAAVSWLMTPWSRVADGARAPLARLLPPPWRVWPRSLAALGMSVLVLGIAIACVRALPAVVAGGIGGALIVRVQGEDPRQLVGVANELLPRLRATPGLENIVISSANEERWRLRLNGQRMEELGLGLTEIGRAFAIAGAGLLVGEIVDADARLPLRLRLAAGAAGETFERLLLRGERRHQPAVYLRDVGVAERAVEPRERLRVQRTPAVEITAQWRSVRPPPELTNLRETVSAPSGYALYWYAFAAPLPLDNAPP